jgi:hypothetical protein
MNYTLINKEEDLKNYIDILKNSKCLAIDTEFVRNNKYYPQLSLLQICYNKQQAIIIDCLAIDNIDAIIDIIYDDNIIKIFHSCNQDLEIFSKDLEVSFFDHTELSDQTEHEELNQYNEVQKLQQEYEIFRGIVAKNPNASERQLMDLWKAVTGKERETQKVINKFWEFLREAKRSLGS